MKKNLTNKSLSFVRVVRRTYRKCILQVLGAENEISILFSKKCFVFNLVCQKSSIFEQAVLSAELIDGHLKGNLDYKCSCWLPKRDIGREKSYFAEMIRN